MLYNHAFPIMCCRQCLWTTFLCLKFKFCLRLATIIPSTCVDCKFELNAMIDMCLPTSWLISFCWFFSCKFARCSGYFVDRIPLCLTYFLLPSVYYCEEFYGHMDFFLIIIICTTAFLVIIVFKISLLPKSNWSQLRSFIIFFASIFNFGSSYSVWQQRSFREIR